MKIVGYLRTSLIEWPGKISSVIFVPGCNFRCPFCHNASLVDPKKFKKLSIIPEKEILADLIKRKKWIDGVVITGGEPTLQPDLPEFLAKIKELGFLTMIQTNGSQPEIISLIVNRKPLIVDYLTLDFKAPLDEQYAKTIGTGNFDPETWIKSFRVILKSGIAFELRTTVVPGIHDEKILAEMASQLRLLTVNDSRLAINWFLQTFQPKNCLSPKFTKIKPYGKIEMENFVKAVKSIITRVELRGD